MPPARHFGFGSADNPIFARMHEASALVSGASVTAAEAVWEGRAHRAVNLSGGLHHAMRDHASGFCVYDDPAVAIAWLLAAGAERVAYVDVDVHHGDGVQAAFYGDPRVLTISLHESGRTLFPGTGFASEIGRGEGTGYSVNVALPAGTGDAGWLRAFEAVVPPLLAAYQPQMLLTQHGCDTHWLDPLAHLKCTVDGQRTAYRRLAELADTCAGGRWVAVGGGGYEVGQVVPRAWTHLLAELTGEPVNGTTPEDWQQEVVARVGGPAPGNLTDRRGERAGADRSDPGMGGLDRHRTGRVDRRHSAGGLRLPRAAGVTDSPAGLDPEIAALRDDLLGFALSLPEAWEDHPWGENVAKVRKKVFAFFGVPGRQPSSGPHGQASGVRGSRALASGRLADRLRPGQSGLGDDHAQPGSAAA